MVHPEFGVKNLPQNSPKYLMNQIKRQINVIKLLFSVDFLQLGSELVTTQVGSNDHALRIDEEACRD